MFDLHALTLPHSFWQYLPTLGSYKDRRVNYPDQQRLLHS